MEIDNFSVIEVEFHRRISKIIWCTFTTVNEQNRPRSRMVHPIWHGHEGWLATGRGSHKAKHIAHNPFVSLTYWDPDHQQVYAECKAIWVDDQASKQRVWDLYRDTPAPLGYDLSRFWPAGIADDNFGLLQLIPWRIELSSLADIDNPQIWRQAVD
jgi:general stress protein 26